MVINKSSLASEDLVKPSTAQSALGIILDIHRIRQRHLARGAKLIYVSQVFVLQAEKVPLEASEHLGYSYYPDPGISMWSRNGEIE